MSERVQFQADEDLDRDIVTGLRRRETSIVFEIIPTPGLPKGTLDPAVLAFAAGQGRILVSHDLKTMPQHFADFLASGQHSAGLVLVPRKLPIAQVIEELYLIWEATTPDYWRNLIQYLPL